MITRVCWFLALCFAAFVITPPPPALALPEVTVVIEDPDDVLTQQQEQALTSWTQQAPLDPTVDTVTFLLWAQAEEPFNDFVKNTAIATYPQLISDGGKKWSDGDVIFALATESHLLGTYAGEDVNAAIGFQANLERIHALMRPALKEGNWQAGLETGVDAVATSHPPAPEEPTDPKTVALGAGIVGVPVLGIGALLWRRNNRIHTRTARALYQQVGTAYGDLAGQLDQINIRANNLSSPLVDQQLRDEWVRIRDGFVASHEKLSTLDHLQGGSDKDFRKALGTLRTIDTSFNELEAARDNIDTMFRLEQGDTTTRQQVLGELHQDLLAATMKVKNTTHAEAIAALDRRCMALYDNPDQPTMLEEYSLIISDYATIMEAVAEEELDGATQHVATPTIASREWHPGYGYNNYVPFVLANTWYQGHIASSSSSSTVSTTYSGGFSGAGGSSRF